MAELATIARPYAEALFQVARQGDLQAWATLVDELAAVTSDEMLRQLADNPRVSDTQLMDLVTRVVRAPWPAQGRNFLRTLVENGRLGTLPEIAAQFRVLVNQAGGVSDAVIHSAYPIEATALDEVVASLEKRFGRKLRASVKVDPSLIGGVRVEVGDEVLDASVKARLERMKAALSA